MSTGSVLDDGSCEEFLALFRDGAPGPDAIGFKLRAERICMHELRQFY